MLLHYLNKGITIVALPKSIEKQFSSFGELPIFTMMIQQRAIGYILVLAISLLLICNEVQGKTKLSYLEDLELENQLKLLNKPAVKSIKTEYGDIYDCVNFYQQPAFDHPLLQNHTFHPQMKPTLPIMKGYSDDSITGWPLGMGLEGVGCPKETVPIRRTTKDDFIRQKLMSPTENVSFSTSFSYGNNMSNKLAIVQTENNPSNKFGGAGMVTAIYTPHVKGQQHSACRLKIQKGSENIQVGWRVDPTLYVDGRSRLYTHFQAGKIQCFNTQCPGFVIVNTKIPLDYIYSPVTQRGRPCQRELVAFAHAKSNTN
ncbi:protein neprosin-like [Nicotiana tabacum]|uniref:Protein neprosin-like n=1 Tax=Nicotiana tabacum TaxID=4097 RepID=A0AC58SMY4_TOBAC